MHILADVGFPKHWHPESVRAVVEGAVEVWSSVDCAAVEPLDGRAPPGLSLEWVSLGQAQSPTDRVNQVHWVASDWPHGSALLAITALTLDEAGMIVDADIAVNVAERGFDIALSCSDGGLGHDLAAVMTHEFGHLLGLDHSQDLTATMFDVSAPGQCRQRTLARDDIDGLCANYLRREVSGESATVTEPGCGSSHRRGAKATFFAFVLVLGWMRRRSVGGVAAAVGFVLGNVGS